TDLDDDHVAFVSGRHDHPTFIELACGQPHVGGLDAVVDRVSDAVNERIQQVFDDRLVEFGVLTFDDEVDLLVESLGEVPDEPGEPAEDLRDGNHPNPQNAFVKLAYD